MSLKASQLYARANGSECSGPFRCHWCGAPCKSLFRHDDPPPSPFTRSSSAALYPSEGYVCFGCWCFRRKRTTVRFLCGDFLDGRSPMDFGWFVTPKGAWAVSPRCLPLLADEMTAPPPRFFLALLSFPSPSSRAAPPVNHLQLAVANDLQEVTAGSTLYFTLDGVVHDYTIHELEAGVRQGPQGRPAGVRLLLSLFGLEPAAPDPILEPRAGDDPPPERKRGRATTAAALRKAVR